MIYDFKDEENEQEIVLPDVEDLVDDIYEVFHNLKRYEFISVYANYEEILMLLLKLYRVGLLPNLNDIKAYYPGKMIIMTLAFDGNIIIQDMINDLTNEPFYSGATLTYVYDSACTLKIVEKLKENDENILHYSYEKDWN